jgi:hypothetical protein
MPAMKRLSPEPPAQGETPSPGERGPERSARRALRGGSAGRRPARPGEAPAHRRPPSARDEAGLCAGPSEAWARRSGFWRAGRARVMAPPRPGATSRPPSAARRLRRVSAAIPASRTGLHRAPLLPIEPAPGAPGPGARASRSRGPCSHRCARLRARPLAAWSRRTRETAPPPGTKSSPPERPGARAPAPRAPLPPGDRALLRRRHREPTGRGRWGHARPGDRRAGPAGAGAPGAAPGAPRSMPPSRRPAGPWPWK